MNPPPLSDDVIDDLHLLMAVAILCGQRGVQGDPRAIFDIWSMQYPQDALADIGRGLLLIHEGNAAEGVQMITRAANTATTRVEQAREVLASLSQEIPQIAG